jgi:short-subunit dehydrogenase
VVLAARRIEGLEESAEYCRAAGGDAHVVPTDVTKEGEVKALVEEALARWGQIDIWVNNAGTTLFAHIDQGAFDLHQEVLQTNLIGAMYAARFILPVFRHQGRGTLINVGSILSKVGQPFTPSYVISKFGLRGLSEALRAEVADEPTIHICTVLPYAVDTPHFQTGGNLIGREAHAMPPAQKPEKVAKAIVRLGKRPKRELHVPRYLAMGIVLHWMLPRTTERLLLHALTRFHFGAGEKATSGNLFVPPAEKGTVHGVRRPLISNPAFALWVIRDLAGMGISSVRRLLQQ